MPEEGIVATLVKKVVGAGHLAWAEGERFFLPAALAEELKTDGLLCEDGLLDLRAGPPDIHPNAAREMLLRRAFTDSKPASARLPFSYQLFPPAIRSLVASVIGRLKRRSLARADSFPAWPLDLSADFLSDLAGGSSSPFARGPCPVLLTHDLDSPEGLRNLVDLFLPEEESAGARSLSFVVPCAWPLDYGLLDEVKARGHGLGIHGHDHSNRMVFSPPGERSSRLDAAHDLKARYGMAGFRAPSLLRTRELFSDLEARYAFDSSIPTSGGLFPVPNNGCASARPFYIGTIAEIPISLPRDGSLLFLGYSPQDILALWKGCALKIARSGGVAVLLTHCERRFSGSRAMLKSYLGLLDFLATSELFTFSDPADILETGLAGQKRDPVEKP